MPDPTMPLGRQVTDQHAHAEELDPVFLLADTDPQAMNAMNKELIASFRATDGHLGGAFRGVPLLLLTTTGARSRLPRTTPVNYTLITGGWVVVASKSGSARHPDWYHNLVVDPSATIELPGATVAVHARITTGPERHTLFQRHTADLPNFCAYQRRTARELPVIVLEPTRSDGTDTGRTTRQAATR